jgi:outer membrane protein assembly factor BamD (BamD/ComL family)
MQMQRRWCLDWVLSCAAAFLVVALATPSSVLAQDDFNFEPVSVEEDQEAKAELEEALKAYKKNDFLRASLILYRITSRNEVSVSPVEQKAEYTLGKTLYRLNLYQASLNFFDRVVQAGPEHRYFKATCKWLYYLSRKISGDPGLLEKIAKYKPQDCPVDFRNELAFLVGQYHYKKGAVETGLGFLKQVGAKSRYFPKAIFLAGISYVRLEKPKPAVEAFKVLRRASSLGGDNITEDLKYFNQLAILSMARVFYSTGQFSLSTKYYDQIGLDSTLWLDSLFEASWTYFRKNNHEKALGHLHTLNSPFFRDEYLPEAPILKAVIFYANCNYERTRQTINDFRLVYEPLRDEIKGYIENFSDPTELYNFLSKLQKTNSGGSGRVNQILNAAFQDKTLKRLNAYVRELDREMDLIRRSKSTWSRSQLAQVIVQETEVVKSLAVDEAGRLAKQRLDRVVKELNDLISQALKIEFEVTNAEKGILENNLAGDGPKARSRKGSLYATDDEHIYWPFTGEYWRDELGYYLYTVKSECGR